MTDHTYRPTVHTQADLLEVWQTLVRPLGFSGASIWLLLLDGSGAVCPGLTEIADADDPPTPEQCDGLVDLLRHFPGLHPAFLRTRPGPSIVGRADRAWAASLYAACRRAGVPAEVVHLGTDESILALPLDELVG